MRFFCIAIAVFLACARAQTVCPPIQFQLGYAAGLTPSANSHQVLLKQPDGSYTAFELSDTSPYRILSTTPNFQKQVLVCPAPAHFAPAGVSPQAVAKLSDGGYLFVGGALDVQTFDSAMNFVAEMQYALPTMINVDNGQPAPIVAGAPVLVDLNGDGIPDIVVPLAQSHDGTTYSSGFDVFLSSAGNYQGPVFYVAPTGFSSWTTGGIAIADFNGDGKPDIAVASNGVAKSSLISIFPGNGDGSFGTPQVVMTLSAGQTLTGTVAAGDFNGDGKLDLAYFYNDISANFVAVALGAGNGTFSTPQAYAVSGPYFALTDVNGDANLDIVVDGVTILYGDGKGGFPRRLDIGVAGNGQVFFTDFNGDGIPDIVVGTGLSSVLTGNAVGVLLGQSNGGFLGAPELFVPGVSSVTGSVYSLTTADFNEDGFPDVALASSPYGGPATLTILKGNGDGTFTTGFIASLAYQPSQILTADFNHDGKPDLAILESYNNSIQIFLGVGNGTFSGSIAVALPAADFNGVSMAVGDFNGDGNPDLALASYTGPGYPGNGGAILLGHGDGTFATPTTFALTFAPAWLAAGDFNGDGSLDLAIANPGTQGHTDGGIAVLLGKGDGTFVTANSIPLSYAPGSGPNYIALADVNRDGKLDLIVPIGPFGSGFYAIGVLNGNGDGTFQSAISYPAQGSIAGVADLNGDRIPDIVTDGGYLLGQGDGTFQPFAIASVSPAAMADYNGDGKLDFARAGGLGLTTTLNLSPAATGPPLVVYSAASLGAGPLAAQSLATAFGANLGTAVTVVDSAGASRSAPLLYTSTHQVNFQVPAGTAIGAATVTVSGAGAPAVSTPVQIAAVAPTLFTLNAAGLVAADGLNVTAAGQTYQPVFTTQNGYIVPQAVPLTGQTYLVLYGTGFRGATGSCGPRDLTATVTYIGPDPQFPGVDQINLLLPATTQSGYVEILMGCGTAVLFNTVYVEFQ